MIQSRQIEAFRAVMLTGAMTAAAETMHITQPAVSRLIRDLEAEIRIRLFERGGKLLVPTAEAKALFAEVERSFIGLAQIHAIADDIRVGRVGSLRLAMLPAMAAGFAPRFVAKFCGTRPNLSVVIDGMPSASVRDQVLAGEFDLGISAFPFRRTSLTAIPLNDAAVVALPADHSLAEKSVVQLSDLRDERLVLLSKTAQHPLSTAFQSAGLHYVAETSLSTIACALVSEGMGVAIVDAFSASEFAGRNVVVRPLRPSFTIGAAIVYAQGRSLSLSAREFLNEFLAHVQLFLGQNNFELPTT